MRGKDFSTGLRGVLFEAQHYERMGAAIWLYGWLVLRQTHESDGVGFVLGGAPVSYREIEEETGFNRRTLERWMAQLRARSYIWTQPLPGGISIRILRAKKFPQRNPQGVRKNAEHRDNFAGPSAESGGASPQNCVDERQQRFSFPQVADGIGSGCVAGRVERKTRAPLPARHDPKTCGCNYCRKAREAEDRKRREKEARERELSPAELLELVRIQNRLMREEEVQRALRVGRGPEPSR